MAFVNAASAAATMAAPTGPKWNLLKLLACVSGRPSAVEVHGAFGKAFGGGGGRGGGGGGGDRRQGPTRGIHTGCCWNGVTTKTHGGELLGGSMLKRLQRRASSANLGATQTLPV